MLAPRGVTFTTFWFPIIWMSFVTSSQLIGGVRSVVYFRLWPASASLDQLILKPPAAQVAAGLRVKALHSQSQPRHTADAGKIQPGPTFGLAAAGLQQSRAPKGDAVRPTLCRFSKAKRTSKSAQFVEVR